MRKEVLFVTCFVLVLPPLGLAVLWLTAPRNIISLENFHKLDIGMSEAEVKALLGEPGEEPDIMVLHLSYPSFTAFGEVPPPPQGGLLSSSDHRLHWLREKGCFLLTFDGKGKLRYGEMRFTDREPETFLGKFRHWLGI